MPHDQPVGVGGFVKQSRTEREWFAAQNCSRDLKQSWVGRYFSNRSISEDVADAGLCSMQLEVGEIVEEMQYLVLS
jgi:hypothetical protein